MAPTTQTTGNVARIAGLIDTAIIEYAAQSAELASVTGMLNGGAMYLTAWDARIMSSLITEVLATLAGASQPLA